MKRSRFTQEQIIGVLKEHQAGAAVADLCRKHGISDATFYTWRSRTRTRSSRKLLAESMLEVSTLKDLLAKTSDARLAASRRVVSHRVV